MNTNTQSNDDRGGALLLGVGGAALLAYLFLPKGGNKLFITKINAPKEAMPGNPVDVEVFVKNLTSDILSVKALMAIKGVTEPLSTSPVFIESGQEFTFTLSFPMSATKAECTITSLYKKGANWVKDDSEIIQVTVGEAGSFNTLDDVSFT